MMQRIKFHPLLVFWIGILLLALACRGNAPGAATPTAAVGSPTPVQSEPSPTPMPAPKADAGAIGLGDSLYPYFGNGGYDVQHYSLDLTIHDVVTSELSGITRIEAKGTQDLSSFNLDFIGFEISTITVNGQPADYKRFRQELTITPATSLPANEPFTVEVHYEGSPAIFRSVALSIQMGWVRYSGGSYVMSEPDGAASFFPANDHPLDKALYTIRVTVPKPFEVAANGTLTETTDNGATTTFLFEMRDPMASYLTTVNIGEFDLETSRSQTGVTIRNYFAVGVPEEARQVFDSQGEMLAHFSDLFGPYPFDEYGALVLDTEIGGALETQTMSLFGIQDPVNGERLESVIAHELAHQWFGDSISLADWRDIWLNESFATYSQGLWIEHTDGRDALDDWIRGLYRLLLENQQYVRPPGQPVADDLFNVGVYYWGAVGLHALRLEVGDEQFFEILRIYYERFENTNVATADFIAVAEEVSGKDLDSFFNTWLYSKTLAPIPSLGLEPKP